MSDKNLGPEIWGLLEGLAFPEAGPDRFAVTNPANGAVLAYVPEQGADAVIDAIDQAEAALVEWSARTAGARGQILRHWYEQVIAHKDILARLVTLEQGRALVETPGEVIYGANFIDWFSQEAKRAYGRTIPAAVAHKQLMTIKQPVGICCAITPWNFPISMITRKVAPALAAGCPIIVKPSEETPLSALCLLALAHRAGVPKAVLAMITTTHAKAVGAAMTSDKRVRKLSFTGSTPVGKMLYEQCAPSVKRLSLELGGNAPFLVFDDADLQSALDGVMASKFRNAGQTCVCANRILVQDGIYASFIEGLKTRIEALRLGNGLDEATTTGPLINDAAAAKVDRLVKDAVTNGAKVITGCGLDEKGPRYYRPGLIVDITPNMDIFNTEIFGPVAAITRFKDEDEAVALANATPFGLAAYAYSQNIARAMRLTRSLDCGMLGINDGVIATEATPFGGVKESGLGREGASEGMEEYLVTRFVSIGGLDVGA